MRLFLFFMAFIMLCAGNPGVALFFAACGFLFEGKR
jgi:hypothetical protein